MKKPAKGNSVLKNIEVIKEKRHQICPMPPD